MNKYEITGQVKRFPGKYGWHYVKLSDEMSSDFRPIINSRWPALLNANFELNITKWKSSIMPIKNGPLFIALPAKVRKAESIQVGDTIMVVFELMI